MRTWSGVFGEVGGDLTLSNDNDPQGDEVTVIFVRVFVLEEALPTNKNDPEGKRPTDQLIL